MSVPEPLTPAEADLQDFPFMPLHVSRLRDSDLAAEESPEACWYAVMLWAAAWHQLPAGSLPDNDAVLARLAGLGRDLRTWRRHKDGAMRGFILCVDGRYYHPVVAEQVVQAWKEKLAYRDRKTKRREIASNAAAARWHGADQPAEDAGTMLQASSADASCIPDAMPKGRGTGTGTGTNSDVDEREGANRKQVPQTRNDEQALRRVLDAAGIALDQASDRWTAELARLTSWIAEGCDIETEILPSVDRVVRRLKPDETLSTLKPVERELLGCRAKARVSGQRAAGASRLSIDVGRPGESEEVTRWRAAALAATGEAAYQRWVAPLDARLVGDELQLLAPSAFAASRVEGDHGVALARAAEAVFGGVRVRVSTKRAAA